MAPVEDPTSQLLVQGALAVGLGLMVGLEREHSEVTTETPPGETLLGVRTFALLSLFGWVTAFLGERLPWVPVAGLLTAGGLLAAQYYLARGSGMGLTTEIAALVTFALGMVVRRDRSLAVALALMTTLLLIAKPWVRQVVPKLRRMDLTATLQLLIVLAVVLPLLPAEARDPWRVLSPRKIGLFVTLIAGISYVGYVLTRVVGRQRGAGLTGLVGGLASSTAVTAAMAQESRRAPSMTLPGQLATFLANAVMFARVLVVTAVISREVARALAVPLGAMGAIILGGALWKWRALRRAPQPPPGEAAAEVPLKNPFALLPALKWGLILSVVLVVSAAARDLLGDRGLLAAAAASGLADVDAITLAVSRQAKDGALDESVATLAITIAVMANTAVKGGLAWVTGGRAFGRDVAQVFAASMVIGVTLAALAT